MHTKKIILAAVLALVVGLLAGRGCESHSPTPHGQTSEAQPSAAVELWTCSMHPQIRQPKPGLCPICAMDLIPVEAGRHSDQAEPARTLELSEAARARAEVAVAPVERREAAVEVRLAGKVQYDETRLAYIAPRVPGRIDRLYANYAGMNVQAGDHLAEMYSPELLSAQRELLLALSPVSGRPGAAESLLEATREKLRLWGLTADQIAEIERSGQVRDHVTFYAPIGGVVVEKDAREGQYVETGMRLFTVADLSRVWILLDAYESDLAWLRYGQEVEFQAETWPGETFRGRISFIDPLIDPATRTAKVRISMANPDGRLKPGMFVRAVVRAPVTADGKARRLVFDGQWICPMHPEIIKEEPGSCDVCGMPLVRAEELGYGSAETEGETPLMIPATAPLITGKRAVVYVAVPQQEGMYEGRDVVLGPRAGDFYIVRDGLREGEQVVVHGAFKLDSSLQIQGKPSMMNPEAAAPARTEQPVMEPKPAGGTAQTLCPIMGGPINKKEFTDYKGMRIYFCCPGCAGTFLADPEKYLAEMRAGGVEPEHLPGAAHEH